MATEGAPRLSWSCLKRNFRLKQEEIKIFFLRDLDLHHSPRGLPCFFMGFSRSEFLFSSFFNYELSYFEVFGILMNLKIYS